MSLDRFIQNYQNFNQKEKKLVDHILSNLDRVNDLSVQELAEEMYISKTSLINFCKKLGFSGYTEMKYYIKSYISNAEIKISSKSFDTSKNEILDEVKKTLQLLSEEKILEFCKEILISKHLYICSRGTSKQLAMNFSNSLNMLGISGVFIDNFNLINVMKNHLSADDTVIIISLSGSTQILQDLAQFSKINGSKLLSVTGFRSNPIQELSDNSLNFYSSVESTAYRDIHSRIGMGVVLNLIVTQLDKLLKGNSNDY